MNEWYLFTFCIECRVARKQTEFYQSCPHQIQGWQACVKECPSLLRAKNLHVLVHRSRPLDHALSIHSVLRMYCNITLIVCQIIPAVVSHNALVFSRVRTGPWLEPDEPPPHLTSSCSKMFLYYYYYYYYYYHHHHHHHHHRLLYAGNPYTYSRDKPCP